MRKKNTSAEFIKTCYSLALIDLMKQKNYYDISISEICSKAGFGRTSYYRYFTNNKDDLILFISELRWEQCKEKNQEKIKTDEGDVLLSHVYAYRDFFILLSSQKLDALLFKIFYQIFGRKDDENEILSYGKAFFAGGYFGVIYEWIVHGCIDTPEHIKQKFMEGLVFSFEQAKKENKQ